MSIDVATDFCVVGLDLSYTSTGMCAMRKSEFVRSGITEALRYKGSLDHPGERLAFLADGIERFIAANKPNAVFAERVFIPPPPGPKSRRFVGDPSMGIKLGMLHGPAIVSAYRHGAMWRHVEPATYRSAVLGFVPRGDDVKKQVAARLKLMGFEFQTDDEADAYCVARYALDLLVANRGELAPVVTQAARRREKKKAEMLLLKRKV